MERKPRTSTNSLSSSSSSKRSQSQPPHSLANGTLAPSVSNGTLAPSIDREKKPSRIAKDSGFHTYNHSRKSSKMTIYDAYATSGPTITTSNSGLYSTTGRYHRSQSQIPYNEKIYTNGDHSIKPLTSKPVPPPKPKSYPNGRVSGSHMASTSFVESNYMNSLPQTNGPNDNDSGQGSSLDQRDYGIYNNEPRYANPPGPYSMDYHYGRQNGHAHHGNGHAHQANGHAHHANGYGGQNNGLDLTNNREYRGSAFELYKKPLSMLGDPNSPPSNSNSRYHNTNSLW